MRILNYLFIAIITIPFGLTSVYAEICPVATYDPSTAGATLPCVKAGQQQLSLKLDYVPVETTATAAEGYYWALNPNFNLSTCEPVGGECAVFNEHLDLIIPVEGVLAGTRHVVTLKLADDFHWKLAERRLIDQDNTVILQQGMPNSSGDFEALYWLEGNFANHFDKLHDVMQLETGVTLPAPQLKSGDEINLRIFHFNDLHGELRTINKSKGDTHYFSQMVKIVKEARAKAAPNEIILFLSAGDDHVGNPPHPPLTTGGNSLS